MNATRELQDGCASKLKALSDETRLSVVRMLLAGGMRVAELNEAVRIEPSLLSHHLQILRDAGLVVASREGRHMLYRLAPHVRPTRGRRALHLGCCRLSFD